MNIEILHSDLNIKLLIEQYRKFQPDLNIDEEKISDVKRLLKKLIRERHVTLQTIWVFLDFTVPLYTYYDFKVLVPYATSAPIIKEHMSFEGSDGLNSVEESALLSLVKKAKLITKDMDFNKARYFLPMSCHIQFSMVLDLISVYEIITQLSETRYTNDKLKEFCAMLMKVLEFRSNIFFNEQFLSTYQATEEKK